MRRLLYGIVCLGTLVACQREPGYKISGSVPGTPDGMKVYLYNWNTPVDSSVVKGGKFVLTGKVDVPTRYQLLIDLSPDKVESYEKDLRGSDVFVDNVDIKYESPSIDSLPSRNSFRRKVKGNVTVTGSPVHDLFLSYQEKLKPYRTRNSEAWDKYLQVYHIPASEGVFNTREGIALTREMNDAQKEITRIQWDFIKANPKSPVSVDVAQNMVYTAKFSKADMDNLLQAIDPSLRETPGYKQLKESLESIAPIALGEKYKDLELVDENGKTVQLSDYVKPGQYNMVEFWASWCGPCRGDIPHLKDAYSAYHAKGFDIVSVSIDANKEQWKKALEQEQMAWLQVCDKGEGFDGFIVKKYGISGVPSSFLIDPQGKIILTNARGGWLDTKLIELFDK